MLVDCRDFQKAIKDKARDTIKELNLKPKLAILQVGCNAESEKYVGMKIKHCNDVGIDTLKRQIFNTDVTTEELVNIVKDMNSNDNITGIIVQLPLPSHIDEYEVLNSIAPIKDIDCLTTYNIGLLHRDKPYIEPCTPKGVIRILDNMNYDLSGKDVLVIGRSEIVGKPLQAMLTRRNATVTLAHSKSKLNKYSLACFDVVISAIGKYKHFSLNAPVTFKEPVLIDVGINFQGGKMAGDFNLEKSQYEWATPVPFGVGTMTTAMVIENVIETTKKIQLG